MEVNRDNLAVFNQTLKRAWDMTFAHATPLWPKFATKWNTTQPTTTIPMSVVFPHMRQWKGERLMNAIRTKAYSIDVLKYEWSMEVEIDVLEDDQYNIYVGQTKAGAKAAKMWPDDLMLAALNNAEDTTLGLGLDDVPFFSASHPIDPTGEFSGTYANILYEVDVDPAGFEEALTAFRGMRDWNNQIIRGHEPNLIIVPRSKATAAKRLFSFEKLKDDDNGGEGPNPYAGMCEVLVMNDLEDQNEWYLLRRDEMIDAYPFIFVERKAPLFQGVQDPTSLDAMMTDTYKYGVKARGNYAYGVPIYAMKCTTEAAP